MIWIVKSSIAWQLINGIFVAPRTVSIKMVALVRFQNIVIQIHILYIGTDIKNMYREMLKIVFAFKDVPLKIPLLP